MFGKDSGSNGSPSQNSGMNNTSADYLRQADAAKAAGDGALAVHLYIIAFKKAQEHAKTPDATAVDGLRKAWDIACDLKERSLAEYVFELLEPFSGSEEVARNAEKLQRMALEKLEEFGFSHEDVEEMADMITDDFLGAGGVMQLGPEALLAHPIASLRESKKDKAHAARPHTADAAASEDAKSDDGKHEATPATPHTTAKDAAGSARVTANAIAKATADGALEGAKLSSGSTSADAEEPFRYDDLVGYDRAIERMHAFGIGLADDKRFNDFLDMLARRHGIDSPPSTETIVLRAYAREDANQFMAATVGEMGVPTVRMYMEESPQGIPVLCVMASSDFKPRLRMGHGAFEGPGVLMLEDVDMWGSPLAGALDEFDAASFAQLSRGAREAVMLIRSAVENPEVTVLASTSTDRSLDEFFYELLDPMTFVDIDVPNNGERADVWQHAATMYPSLRFLDREELVHLSANMSRYDIYMAAREAVEQAYRESVERRSYVPVTRGNMLDKVAAYQPLDSKEYQSLEDAAVDSFRADLDHLDDLLEGSAE